MKYGLKLWSIDGKDLFKQAIQLFNKKKIDFVELYIVPDSFVSRKHEVLNELKNIPTAIHAPHSEHNFDVFKLDDSKIKFFKNQIIKSADFLNSKFIIIHAETGSSHELFKQNIKKINDKRILIENMPKFGIDKEICFGHSYDQLKFIRDCGLEFCLDLGHAIKSALAQNLDYKEFIKKLILNLNPCYFHISNGKIDNVMDEHRDLFDGEFDIKWLKETLIEVEEKKEVYLVFETPKGKNGLENDIKNMDYFRLCGKQNYL